MNFDEEINRIGTHSTKWDAMESYTGVSNDGGLPMWVADMDFRPPHSVRKLLQEYVDTGVYGYFGDDSAYRASICWWMQTRHGWQIEPYWIFSTHGLVNGTAMCVEAFTAPGDAVILFTPVYHAFHRILKEAGREIRELPLANRDGRYEMDFDTYETMLTGSERMIVLCSPHNPGGRVWTQGELTALGSFAKRHDLMIVSDEIHHDLVFPGHKHLPMAVADPSITDRLLMLTAPTKTFNLAGIHTGNVIVPDADLRAAFASRMGALGISPNAVAQFVYPGAYSPEGAAWLEECIAYLDGNRQIFDAGIAALPGVRSMPLESTYLSWVDFSGTGMEQSEFSRRVAEDARIGVNKGPAFGKGGDSFLRFNIATRRALVEEAVERLHKAFADLQ